MIFGERTPAGDSVLTMLVSLLFNGNYRETHRCDPGCDSLDPVSVACGMSVILHHYKCVQKRKMTVKDYADAFVEELNSHDTLADHKRMSFMCGIYSLESTNLEDLYSIIPLVTTKLRHTTMPRFFKGFCAEDSSKYVSYKLACEAHWRLPTQVAG